VRWTLDLAMVQGDEAVIDWSMRWPPAAGSGEPELLRGTAWYTFRAGTISEIRSHLASCSARRRASAPVRGSRARWRR